MILLCQLPATVFHNFFINKLITIRGKITLSLTKLDLNPAPSSFMPGIDWISKFCHSAPVTTSDAYQVIVNLKNSMSNFDFILTVILKKCTFFAPSITHLANLSFKQSSFQDLLKTGCVKPILKN